jgi:hypothetical protein
LLLSQLAMKRSTRSTAIESTRSSLLPKAGEVALDVEVDGQAALVADHMHLGVLDRRQRIRRDRQAGDAAGHGAQDVAVVQRHLDALVAVLVVHVVDDVQRIHVGPASQSIIWSRRAITSS